MTAPVHRCHAIACTDPVEPQLFMCPHHWKMVPKDMQDAIWAAYRPGQEIDKRPSGEYLGAARRAMTAVAVAEGIIRSAHPPRTCELTACGATAPFGFFVFFGSDHPGLWYCGAHKYLGEQAYATARAPIGAGGPMPRQGVLL